MRSGHAPPTDPDQPHPTTPGDPPGVFSYPQEAVMSEKKIDVPELDDDQEICEGIPTEEDDDR